MIAKYAKAWVAAIAVPTLTVLTSAANEALGVDLSGITGVLVTMAGTALATWAIPNAA